MILLQAKALIAGDDPSACDEVVEVLARCGVKRTSRVRSAQALRQALQSEPPDFTVLIMPMFEIGPPAAGKSFDPTSPPFLIVSDGKVQSVHRLMDSAFDHRWRVASILNQPVDMSDFASALARMVHESSKAA